VDFAGRVPFYGAVVACGDDHAVRGLVPRLTRRVITYGFSPDVDVCGIDPVVDGDSARCHVRYRLRGVPDGTGEGTIVLGVPGRHNLSNALAAVAVGIELGVPFARIQATLAEFRGAERRYQTRGVARGIRVIDDYGHHPTEITAVIQAARDGRPSRIVAVFQPHRYSRTRDLFDAFGPALSGADIVVLTDIYPAGEAPVPGITLERLADTIRPSVPRLIVVPKLDAVPDAVAAVAASGDVVLTLGAGSISHTAARIVEALEATS
jgi:UDP-N-acetylmuramate--alanine ligase